MTEEPKKWKPEEKPVKQAVAGKDYSLAPIVATKQVTPPDPRREGRQLMAKMANAYITSGIVSDFGQFPIYEKFALFARTPKKFILTRQVGGIAVPYVNAGFAMKVLNFAFNFDISQEITDMKLVETKVVTKNGPKTAYLGAVTCKFTFHDPCTNRDFVRTVRSSHQMFLSPATTPDDAIKSAISKSWTLAAKSFGLFGDIKDVDREEEVQVKVETGEIYQPKEKDFGEF